MTPKEIDEFTIGFAKYLLSEIYNMTFGEHSIEELLENYKKNIMKRYDELEDLVIVWAKQKGIFEKGTPIAQQLKTEEEVQELSEAICKNDKEEIIDALGDILVTIIIQAEMQGLSLIDCLESAYNVISKRTGKMVNGQFLKD